MKTTTEMQLVPITKLVPYVNNARTHSPEQINKLRSSLREFGFINPVIIDRDYGVIAGHGRILAAKEEGITEVPCVFADHLTEAQKKAYIIADNRMAMDAGWNEELLRVEIESLQAADFDPLLTGFDEKELSKLFDDGIEAEEDDFDVDAELQKPTFSKPGDIWMLGRHRLICGDSTKEETYAALMDGRKANLVITDPPYNVNYEGSAGKIKNDNMASEKFFDFLFDAFSNIEKVMADDASIYVFHADTEGLNFRKAFDAAGFYLSGCCIWKKQSLVLGRSPYQWQHEPCLYGWKKKGKHQWYTGRKESTIWEFDKPRKNGDHPTMKPIEKFIESLGERFNIREIAFDRWGAVQMVQNLEGMGFTVVPFGQGFKDMSPPTKELMKLVLEQRIAHGGHPVLRWMMDNIFIRTDPAGNIKPDKEKSTEKIDGAVATIMALDRAIRCGNENGASVYDDRGILFI